MRHRKNDTKLGRTGSHRRMMLASMVCSLIERKRIETTLPKAKLARTLAERMVTLARGGGLAAMRQAESTLVQRKCVSMLFKDIAPKFEGRNGGYTRILKTGRRMGDGAEMAMLEWVDIAPVPTRKKKKVKKDEEAAK